MEHSVRRQLLVELQRLLILEKVFPRSVIIKHSKILFRELTDELSDHLYLAKMILSGEHRLST